MAQSSGFECKRWNNAMRICVGADPKHKGRGRWKGDPIALNDEAFFMTPEDQNAALDYMEDASPALREALLPLWKFCFAQWIIFDAGKEAEATAASLPELLASKDMMDDVESLRQFVNAGGMEKAKKSEKWTWKMLEPLPLAGSAQEYGNDNNSPVVQAAREERTDGCEDFNEGKFERAFWHFNQGIRHLARLPEPLTPLQAKLACDLFKNVAAAALKLGCNRIALNVADAAIALGPTDQKAWFRKACALQNLDRDEEATEAFMYAGYVETEKDLGPRVDPQGPPLEMDQSKKDKIEKLSFLECGIDSMDAVEMIAIMQDKITGAEIPRYLTFAYPTVGEAAKFLGAKAQMPQMDTLEIIYRAMCDVLNRDPLKVQFIPKMLTEEKAIGALLTLLEMYETKEYIEKCDNLARKANNEYKPFLQSLKRHALECQVSVLEVRGFPATFEGMRRFECSIITAARDSKQVRELMIAVRKAAYGAPNGMWKTVMGDADLSEDSGLLKLTA